MTLERDCSEGPSTAETGEQVPARPHDAGSQANETIDGLDASAEALRHAAEDLPTGATPDDIEKIRCLTGRDHRGADVGPSWI
jgi:hypothetical protein